MSSCTFCLKDGGEEGCIVKLNKPNVIRFLCQEFKIDFAQTFGLDVDDPLNLNQLSLIIPLCTDCDKLFEQIGLIKLLFDEVKGQFDKVLLKIRSQIIMSPYYSIEGKRSLEGEGTRPGQDVIDEIVNRNGEILRSEIIRSSVVGEKSVDEEGNIFRIIPPIKYDDFDDQIGEDVVIKMEEPMGTYQEEDVEAFNNYTVNPNSNTNPRPPPLKSVLKKMVQSGHFSTESSSSNANYDDEHPSPSTSETIPPESNIVNGEKSNAPCGGVSSQPRAIGKNPSLGSRIPCQLCPFGKTNLKNIFQYQTHIREFHSSVKCAYICTVPDCGAQYPVLMLWNRHLKFHEDIKVNPYSCSGCFMTYKTEDQLNNHLKWHDSQFKAKAPTGPNRPKLRMDGNCKLCPTEKPYKYWSFLSYTTHIQEWHKTVSQLYTCSKPGCDEKFPVQKLLRKHILFHDTKNLDALPYGCRDCCTRYVKIEYWKKHLEWHEKSGFGSSLICRFCSLASVDPAFIRSHEISQHQNKLVHACPSCQQTYSSASILEAHVEVHIASCSYQCKICSITFGTGGDLDGHMLQFHIPRHPHSLIEKTCCTICGKFFDTPTKLKAHVLKLHSNREKIYVCEFCPDKTFSQSKSYILHVARYHEIGEKQLNCPKCPKQFVTNIMLQKHIENHKLDATKPLACEICDCRFAVDDHARLEHHKNIIHVFGYQNIQKPYSCTAVNCDRSFKTPRMLHQHEIKHPELLIYNCNLCDKVYSVEAFLQTHMKTHVDVSDVPDNITVPFGCTVCKQKFTTSDLLAAHLLSHTGESRYSCTKCTEKCNSPSELTLHMVRKHKGKCPFECEVCGKKFAQRYRLTEHKLTHKELAHLPKPLPRTCRRCGLQFPTRKELLVHNAAEHKKPKVEAVARICELCGKSVKHFSGHMQIHKGDKRHACYFCTKRFLRYDALRYHLFTHTRERPFMCHICHKDFNQIHCLKDHMIKVHSFTKIASAVRVGVAKCK